jgi:hypothetical protein
MPFTGNYTCDTFKSGLLAGSFDFAAPTTDVYKIALYTNNATLNAQTTAYSATDEVVASGYTAGGEVISPTVGLTNGVSYLSFSNASWNASLAARGALVYRVSDGAALFVLDFGSDKTSNSVFQVQFPLPTSTTALVKIS